MKKAGRRAGCATALQARFRWLGEDYQRNLSVAPNSRGFITLTVR